MKKVYAIIFTYCHQGAQPTVLGVFTNYEEALYAFNKECEWQVKEAHYTQIDWYKSGIYQYKRFEKRGNTVCLALTDTELYE